MNITVYLGANEGNDPSIAEAARELGSWIWEIGNDLVYGGSKVGLMGILAESALNAGAQVTGVEPQFFIDQAVQLDTITRLIVTDTMAERKAKMIELGDAFIAFPGGSGTLEEVSEVMSMLSLSHLDAPCIIYNLDGYYNHLKAQINLMIEKGFSTPERLKHVHFASNLNDVKGILGRKHISRPTTRGPAPHCASRIGRLRIRTPRVPLGLAHASPRAYRPPSRLAIRSARGPLSSA